MTEKKLPVRRNEADMKLGNTVASSWGQKILPKIKSNYKGKVLWKVGLGEEIKSWFNLKP